jgi:hypothetical protein
MSARADAEPRASVAGACIAARPSSNAVAMAAALLSLAVAYDLAVQDNSDTADIVRRFLQQFDTDEATAYAVLSGRLRMQVTPEGLKPA